MLKIYRIIKKIYAKLVWFLIYKPSLKSVGKKSTIYPQIDIIGNQFLSIGDNSVIKENGWILALKNSETNPNISIKNNCYIGHFCHIVAINSIEIEDDVLIANKVYISDNYHGFESLKIPYHLQEVKSKAPVKIGKNCWIGENCSIISCTLGDNVIIGANSVVTKDIPSNSMAVGSPAKVIKKFNIETNIWEKI